MPMAADTMDDVAVQLGRRADGTLAGIRIEFLSPYSNQRTDEYGGNTENRTKILVEIYDQLTDEVGKNFPIMAKLQT